jgi:ABC-type Co2+ transport system permease subunit
MTIRKKTTMIKNLKPHIISTVRIAVAAVVGSVISYLVTQNLLTAELEESLKLITENLSFVIGTVAYYLVARILESKFPFLLGLKFPHKKIIP